MIYLSPQARPPQRYRASRHWGQLLTPATDPVAPVTLWAADNNVYTGKLNWDRYYTWLTAMQRYRETCLFVTVPDSVGNAAETLDRYRYYAWRIKAMGYPVALVAQDGMEALAWPREYDALFIGGSTQWKLGAAGSCIARGHDAGAWIHVGRINSQARIRHFCRMAVHSADGTSIAHSPDKMYARLDRALREPCQQGLPY